MIALEGRAPARDTLIEEYGHLCSRASKKFVRPGLDKADLQQIAAIGLIKACDRYDKGSATPFEAFAWLFIIGELMHFVRDHERLVRAPRQLRKMDKRVQAAQDMLTGQLGREPSTCEIAEYLHAKQEEVREAYMFRERAVAESLDDLSHEARSTIAPAAEPETSLVLNDALTALTQTERTIVLALYAAGYSQLELAARLGYSRRHISRLHRRALKKMRSRVVA